MKLASGVNLHVIKETKFKTIRIMVRLREALTQENIAKRVIISNLWETTNAAYPTAQAFSSRLSELYGTSFSTAVNKKGSQHLLSIHMNLVNPKYVDIDTLAGAVDFMHKALFKPDENVKVFQREKTNLINYLKAMNEDRSYYASRQLATLFYSDNKQALPGVSTVELLEAETAEAVFAYYKEMLDNNLIDIFVLGDVDKSEIEQLFQGFDFKDRHASSDIFYSQELKEYQEKTEEKEVQQSILQLAFAQPTTYGSADYMSLQVMNGLFGGFAHSKLFMNVREKASLAYYASSAFDSFTGLLKVNAGIDAGNFQLARELILEQLQAMQSGNFTDQEIEQTKTMLKNSYFMSLDSSSNLIEQAFIQEILPERYVDADRFLNELEAVTKEDIMRLAQGLKLQVQYFMKGEVHAEENL
ncbi:EF-P 5-aminopentanol modification-associated protein YfmF [Lactococcus garvieae]|jgi:predicted Zn-dependent peptidase|uniref:EF-P 5-aminopentanol modification-associated protein YfmF n=1 Tax=Lactococcus garvieae TaxID=1363 RepID=UPI0018D90E69|nr:pitrilysin family protein [Lactococcus garvieae]QPS70582.1 insulinase family protein [Lactococcus garvieae]